MSDTHYPRSVAEVLDPRIQFDPAVLECVKRFARRKPWRGTLEERRQKFRTFHVELATACGVNAPRLIITSPGDADSTRSSYVPKIDALVLRGPLSVVTILHEFAHKLHGADERQACRWSINLFKQAFPLSFARCHGEGHLLRSSRHDGRSR